MITVGAYTMEKSRGDYILTDKRGTDVGRFPTARAAMEHGIKLTAAAYKRDTK